MYQEFIVPGRDIEVKGYHFGVENPNHVVVVVHGIGEHAGRYKRVASYFNEKGVALIAMDLRGHGKTPGVRGDASTRNDIFGDIDALIEYAKSTYPGVPVIVYGHSMGGGIVSDYRARGNTNGTVQGFIISAPWLLLVNSFPDAAVKAIGAVSKLLPKLKISSACDENDLGNPEFVRPYKDDPLVHPYITLRTAYQCFSIGKAIAEGTNEKNENEGKVPTLLMHGSLDKICDVNGSRKLAELNKDNPLFTYVEWEGYYHEIHNGGPNGETGEEPISRALEFILGI